MKRFEGKTAAITGAARGIGLGAAHALAHEGCSIAILDRDLSAARAAAQQITSDTASRVIAVAVDITNLEDVRNSHLRIVSELAAPDIFVNCAAIVDDKLFLDSGPDDWRRVLAVDLDGAMNCLSVFLPGMVERGKGRMVYLASDAARLGQARLSYYAAAKAAVVALIKSVAQEVGRSGVTLNIVSPGATQTEMRSAREALLLEQMGAEKYERRQKSVLKMYPTGRLGEPRDIAGAIAFLASDDAGWITGQVLSVNGGFTMA